MDKHKLKDLIDAATEEARNVAEEEVLPTVVKEAGGFIVSEGVGMLASEIVGAVVPVANNIRLSYKQNRLERNVVEALQIVQRNQDELEDKIVKLQQSNLEYQRQITEALLDNIVEEPQETMVQYNANGYVNLLKLDNTNLDIVLMFFKTLAQLSDLDIRVLKSYSYFGNDGESLLDICKDIHIDFEQMRFIREKLERFGLLQSKNEEINDNNLEAVVKYLQNLEKESKKSKPGTVKIPKLKRCQAQIATKLPLWEDSILH
ncbi:MAG: hypothetical protein ACLR6B_14910 [Blautia sp.]